MPKLIVPYPNFSIVTPTGCNASCDFCFWDRENPPVDREQYLTQLWDVLCDLPDSFQQCSITGGEPTMLPWLKGILVLARKRFDKVVLSTNGWDLHHHMYIADLGLINHLNISRHGIGWVQNRDKFGTDNVISDDAVKALSTLFQRKGIDVALNCVLPPNFNDSQFIHRYINYAKNLNANLVAFRKDHSTLEYMGVENDPEMGVVVNSTGCPACRNDIRLIDGMTTVWKYSTREPSNDLGGIYELVYHQDGRLTSDWKGENIINTDNIECYAEEQ